MVRSPRQKSRKRSSQPLLEKGAMALALGVGGLFMSMVLSGHVLLAPLGLAVRTPAWLAIGIGALLLVFHALTQRRTVEKDATKAAAARAAAPAETQSLNAVWHGRNGREAAQAIKRSPASTPAVSSEAARPSVWSAAVFEAIEWRRFEAVCEALFAQANFEPRTQSHGADGGVDIWLYSKHAEGPALIVQCKHWRGKPVGVKHVREFFGVMASHQLKRGTYATTSTFTADATDFAKRNGIHLLDGAGLLKLISQRTPEQQQTLLAVAFEGDYARPTCASCGTKMEERTKRVDGEAFWGCVNYPRCRSRLNVARHAIS